MFFGTGSKMVPESTRHGLTISIIQTPMPRSTALLCWKSEQWKLKNCGKVITSEGRKPSETCKRSRKSTRQNARRTLERGTPLSIGCNGGGSFCSAATCPIRKPIIKRWSASLLFGLVPPTLETPLISQKSRSAEKAPIK